MDVFLLFSKKKGPKNPPKNPPQNSPRTLFGKIPSDFCRSLLLKYPTSLCVEILILILSYVNFSEKLEKAVTVDFKKHPAQKVWTRPRAVSTQGSRKVCAGGMSVGRGGGLNILFRARNSHQVSRFRKYFPQLSRSFPPEPSFTARKQSQLEKRPASYRDPKPQNPKFLEKKLKITPRAPGGNF